MSYTTMYAAGISGEDREPGDMLVYEEFANSWGSAAHVWWALAQKYLGSDDFRDWDKLIEYEKHGGEMEDWERDVLLTTYDAAVIPRELMPRLADSFDRFHSAHHRQGYVDHTQSIAVALRSAHSDGARAVGFWQTSVGESVFEGVDDGEDEWRAYILDVDSDHWFIARPSATEAKGGSNE